MAEATKRGRGSFRWRNAEVQDVQRLGPHLVRVVLGGPDLDGFEAGTYTDHYVKLQLAPPGAPYSAPFDVEEVKANHPRELWPKTRTYSVQNWDAERGLLTIDFVDHGEGGFAGPWARNAKPGDILQLSDPGGAYAPDPEADWHLLVGDASVLPAISASLPRVPAGVPVHVIVEVPGPDDQVELQTPGDLRLTWLHRDPDDLSDDALIAALEALDAPPGRVHAFVHGEASAVRAVRTHLLAGRGLERDQMSVSGYWKRTRDEDSWREEKADWAKEADAEVEAAAAR